MSTKRQRWLADIIRIHKREAAKTQPQEPQ